MKVPRGSIAMIAMLGLEQVKYSIAAGSLADAHTPIFRREANDAVPLAAAELQNKAKNHTVAHQSTPSTDPDPGAQPNYNVQSVPTEKLVAGHMVKFRNRHSGLYLTACAECAGIAGGPMAHDCPNLVGAAQEKSCLFTANACVASTFQVIKVGYSLNNPVGSGDLILLKTQPSRHGDSDFYSYLGVCGASSMLDTPAGDTAAYARLFFGNSSNPVALKTMQEEVMWTMWKETTPGESPDSTVLLGEYVSINKAATNALDTGAGTFLASDNASSTHGALSKCAARNNVYTRAASRLTPQAHWFMSQWIVELNSTANNPACTDAADINVVNTHPGDGHRMPSPGTGPADVHLNR